MHPTNIFRLMKYTALLCAIPVVADAIPQYQIHNLGTFGGTQSIGYGVNDQGSVAGFTRVTLNNASRGFISHQGGSLIDIGSIGGVESVARDINNQGLLTGRSRNAQGRYHAFAGNPASGLSDLGTLGGSHSQGNAINDNGQVAGYSNISGDAYYHAFVGAAGGGLTDLGTLGGSTSYAWDINDNGDAVGYAFTSGNAASHAFIGNATEGLTDLGTLGGSHSYAFGVNNNARVTGYSYLANSSTARAFIGDATGGLISIGSLNGQSSIGRGINDSDRIVGRSLSSTGANHAFVWDPIDGMFDLNDLVSDLTGWTRLTDAWDISNSGYITGYGDIVNGQQRAFLLEPIADNANGNVPEPLTLALFGLGLLGVASHRRHQQRKTSGGAIRSC